MLLGEIFRVALTSLRANKLRSVLTMLGIVIGVAAVIAMIALGNGAENSVKERIARLGTTVLQINPQRVQQGGVGTATNTKLTTKDADMISDRSPNVVAVNYQQDRSLQVIWKNKNTNVQVTGTISNFLEVRGFKIDRGRVHGSRRQRASESRGAWRRCPAAAQRRQSGRVARRTDSDRRTPVHGHRRAREEGSDGLR